jgi:hypothetical protein
MADTVTAAVPLLPSLVAVIVALPGALPVTSPLPETAATVGVLLTHTITRPDRGWPSASKVDAVSWSVPAGARVPLVGLTTTAATASKMAANLSCSSHAVSSATGTTNQYMFPRR